MRSNMESGDLRKVRMVQGKFLPLKQTLSGTFTIDEDMPTLMFLDPDGSGRTILLPAEASSKGLQYIIVNTETVSGDLTVKEDAGSTTIGVVGIGDIGHFFCDGTTWYGWTVDTASIATLAISGTLTVPNTGLKLTDTGGDHYTTLKQNSDEDANRTLNIPALGGDDTLATLGLANAFTGANTHAGVETFSTMFKIPAATVVAAGSVQGDAAAVTTGFTLVTAADATKGVALPTAAAGLVCIIKNDDAANAILKIWPASSDAINALGANNSFSIAAKTSVMLVAYDATTWYSLPLLPS